MTSWTRGIACAGATLALLATAACKGGGGENDGGPMIGPGVGGHPQPVAGHPHLWLTEAQVPDLQGRATASNPYYASGLQKLAQDYKMLMDTGQIPASPNDCADSSGYGGRLCEWLMEVFGLMSNVDPDPKERDDYGRRGRQILMTVIELAKQGPLQGDPIRDPSFPTGNRANTDGEAYGLAVDWLYPYLTTADKADIREVFLQWADADVNASTTTDNHPTPVGVFNDPKLLQDPVAVRFAGNNYFTGHGLNLALMAMALDDADDPGGKLHAYLDNATGGFLYMTDALLRGDSRGGQLADGFEYSPLTLRHITELMWALHTAGEDDASKRGPQVVMGNNPFYKLAPGVYLHQMAPVPTPLQYPGPFYSFSSYGDLEIFAPDGGASQEDPAEGLGPIGLLSKDAGDTATYDAIRWIETNMPPEQASGISDRVSSDWTPRVTQTLFLLMDPKAPPGADPRPGLGTDYYSDGVGFLYARTGWGPMDSYFVFSNCWQGIDHRHSDDDHFAFFRKGEWITQERAGYGFYTGPDHNNVCVQNDAPGHDGTDQFAADSYQTGSSYVYSFPGDPKVLAHSVTADYAYALGDATAVHNSTFYQSTGVTHLSRSIFWLKPDHVITYDRAATKSPGFKQVRVQLPADPQVSGASASAKTMGGQGIFYTSLLPKDAVLSNESIPSDSPANGEPMTSRLLIDAPSKPASVTFLGVLQGADPGASADPATLVTSQAGTSFEGVVVKGAAVLFPVDLSAAFTTVTFSVPASAKLYVTGLAPSTSYQVTTAPSGANVTVTVQPGAGVTTDAAGVLSM
jgi:hypothetical protein